MRRTIIGLFKSFHQAERAIREIEAEGYANNQISLVRKENAYAAANDMEAAGEPVAGLSDGGKTVVDSTLVKEDHLEIPGIGRVTAGGPVAGALIQGDKSLAETLGHYGIVAERAREVENCVRDGYTLAVIETNNDFAAEVANLLSGYGAHGVEKWSKNTGKPVKPWN